MALQDTRLDHKHMALATCGWACGGSVWTFKNQPSFLKKKKQIKHR